MRSLARWGCLPLLAAPLGSWALGLGGDIETHSYLNQPLNAEIPFTATEEEMRTLRVSLAPVSMFSAQGIEYPAVLNTVQLRIGRNAAGQNVVLVSSTQSIGEPFLTILVQATHNRGSITREYTVILDPPLFLSNQGAPEPISAPATRPAPEAVAGGAIQRPPAEPVRQPAQPPAAAPAVSSSAPPAPSPAPAGSEAVGSDGASYTVQGGDTLWSIAERYRPSGASTNQTMISIFETNPAAFEGNINRLRRGAILRIPPATTIGATSASAATTEVRRQIEEWRASGVVEQRLVLLPPSEGAGAAAPGGAGDSARVSDLENQVELLEAELAAARAEAAEASRLLEIQSQDLANLQTQAAEEQAAADTSIETLVDEDAIFADDVEAAPEAADAAADAAVADAAVTEEPAAEAAPPPAVTPTPPATPEPSIVDQVIAQVMKPVVYIPALIVVLVIAALAFLRRRRGDLEDVTGQWEALEAEIDEESDHAATARIRARSREPDMVVVEGDRGDETAEELQFGGTAEIEALTMDVGEPPRPRAKAPPRDEPDLADQTMSSQTVINLDQADPIAEADFHMAYGLYDQAADLISKALSADPADRRLKLKLLEVYFVWGNKESFLESAQNLRSEIGGGPDWDKVVIMGKQICPDEPLFSEATASAGEVDLDLESSAEAPGLDFAFDESDDDSMLDFGVEDGGLSLAASGAHRVAGDAPAADSADDDMLDIGAQTQAGLEAALLDDLDDAGGRTLPGGDIDDLDSTMESPTVETEAALSDDDFGALTLESPTVEALGPDAPTVETPTIESRAAGFGGDTVEQPRPEAQSSTVEMTAEIELDDLGLDVSELEDLSDEILELPGDAAGDDDEMLSATGVTQVLHDDDGEIDFTGTAVIEDEEATMLAPGFDVESTAIRTAVLEQRPSDFDPDPPATEDDLDLNLDDFSSALDGGADTIEQPMASRFSGLDLDIGADDVPADDEPTGTEEFSPLDPQTMTEVGTKLDLARAYIDMGDPEGAKSILEEVLSEGDAGQRSEAQALIDALPA